MYRIELGTGLLQLGWNETGSSIRGRVCLIRHLICDLIRRIIRPSITASMSLLRSDNLTVFDPAEFVSLRLKWERAVSAII